MVSHMAFKSLSSHKDFLPCQSAKGLDFIVILNSSTKVSHGNVNLEYVTKKRVHILHKRYKLRCTLFLQMH